MTEIKYKPVFFDKTDKAQQSDVATITLKDGTSYEITNFFIYGQVTDIEKNLTEEEVKKVRDEKKDRGYLMLIRTHEIELMIFRVCKMLGAEFVKSVQNGLLIYSEAKRNGFKINL